MTSVSEERDRRDATRQKIAQKDGIAGILSFDYRAALRALAYACVDRLPVFPVLEVNFVVGQRLARAGRV